MSETVQIPNTLEAAEFNRRFFARRLAAVAMAGYPAHSAEFASAALALDQATSELVVLRAQTPLQTPQD